MFQGGVLSFTQDFTQSVRLSGHTVCQAVRLSRHTVCQTVRLSGQTVCQTVRLSDCQTVRADSLSDCQIVRTDSLSLVYMSEANTPKTSLFFPLVKLYKILLRFALGPLVSEI